MHKLNNSIKKQNHLIFINLSSLISNLIINFDVKKYEEKIKN